MYQRILVVNDGSPGARRAFDVALGLAQSCAAELQMILVQELARFPTTIGEVDDEKATFDRRFAFLSATAAQRAADFDVTFRAHIVMGRLVERVLACVGDNRIDLLVVGPLQRWSFGSFLVGSPAERLVRSMPSAIHRVK
jgi:nucleotide-binding universal stress UspA family protein